MGSIIQPTPAITVLEKQRLGYSALTLSNFDTSGIPQIIGNVEVAGSLYSFPSLESVSNLAGVANGEVWIKLVPAVDGSIAATWTSVAPVWSDIKQGWYPPTAGQENHRYVFVAVKVSNSNINNKRALSSSGAALDSFRLGGWSDEAVRSTPRFVRVYTSGNTWIAPAGCKRALVFAFGAGGGSGGRNAANDSGGGGGGPACAIFDIDRARLASFSYSLGAAGAAGSAAPGAGGNGGPTVLLGLSLGGGGGGAAANGSTPAAGGSGGIVSGELDVSGVRLLDARPGGRGGNGLLSTTSVNGAPGGAICEQAGSDAIDGPAGKAELLHPLGAVRSEGGPANRTDSEAPPPTFTYPEPFTGIAVPVAIGGASARRTSTSAAAGFAGTPGCLIVVEYY